jgi:hypothetical protein
MASNTRLRLTTQIGQVHVDTGVLLNLGTNKQPTDPRTQWNTKPRVHWPTPVRTVSSTGQTGPYWWNLVTSRKRLHTGQAGATYRSHRSQPKSPKNTKLAYRPPNKPKLKTAPTQDNCKTPDFHRKPESLYHRDSPWISGYRVQNVSQNVTQSHTSHHIKLIAH